MFEFCMDETRNGKKTEVQRTRAARFCNASRKRDRRIRRTGSTAGIRESVGTNCPDWAGGNLAAVKRLGGILSQLISETEDQLAESRKSVEKLEYRLELLNRLRDIQKSVDNED